MAFIRSFDTAKIDSLTDEKAELFARIKADVLYGEVFVAVRKDELHFYYKGGCLYKFNGNEFSRDSNYNKYSENAEVILPYEKAKQQNFNRYKNADDTAKERQLLDNLNKYTFAANGKTQVIVLDIEVRLNGESGGNKKCDIVLLNTLTNEIMFVEGKVFKDKRVSVAVKYTPEVIEQVKTYTAAIAEQRQEIVMQYGNHIRIINEVFGTRYSHQIKLIDTAKLLVYETPTPLTINGRHSIEAIKTGLGIDNAAFFPKGNEPTPCEIWSELCK